MRPLIAKDDFKARVLGQCYGFTYTTPAQDEAREKKRREANARATAKRRRRIEQEHREGGLCEVADCGAPLTPGCGKRCPPCVKAARARARERAEGKRLQWAAAGLCQRDGRPLDGESATTCSGCLAEGRERARRRRGTAPLVKECEGAGCTNRLRDGRRSRCDECC